MSELIEKAAEAIRSADALLFTAGAGMGVDSGLPDFRGNDGFWNAYPAYRHLGLSFSQLANPEWFDRDPPFAWGFYGHRLNLYRAAAPHAGFAILKKWAQRIPARIFTSNVDGHFQKAGFAEEFLTEVHGSIHHLQCTRHCGDIWSAVGVNIRVDPETFRATGDLPALAPVLPSARPNILMFGDGGWLSTPHGCSKEDAFEQWRAGVLATNLSSSSNAAPVLPFPPSATSPNPWSPKNAAPSFASTSANPTCPPATSASPWARLPPSPLSMP